MPSRLFCFHFYPNIKMPLSPYLNIATRAISSAGKILIRCMGRLDPLGAKKKYQFTLIDEAKLECEQHISGILLEAYPEHMIQGEEVVESKDSESDFQWLVKPLDGTTNFSRALPFFALSVALQQDGETLVGLIYDPVRNELFAAARGEGAWVNKQRIRTTEHVNLSEAVFGVGLSWEESPEERCKHQSNKLVSTLAETRKSGCADLDLAYVAAGRMDGWWSCELKASDMAAGALLVAEAGGVVSDLAGKSGYLESGSMLATSMSLREDVVALHKAEAAKEDLKSRAATGEAPESARTPSADEHFNRRDQEEGDANRYPASGHDQKQYGRRSDRGSGYPHRQQESGNTRRSPRPFNKRSNWEPREGAPGSGNERFASGYSDRGYQGNRDQSDRRGNRRQDWSPRQNESGNTRGSPRPYGNRPGWEPRDRAPGSGNERFASGHSDRGYQGNRDQSDRRGNRRQDWSPRHNESGNTRGNPRFGNRPGWEPHVGTPVSGNERFSSGYSDRGHPDSRGNRRQDWSPRHNESGNTRRSPRSFGNKPGWEPRDRPPRTGNERFASGYSDRGRPPARGRPDNRDRPDNRGRPDRRGDRSSDRPHLRDESGNTRRDSRPFANKPEWEPREKTPGTSDSRPASEGSGHVRPKKEAQEASALPLAGKRSETKHGSEKHVLKKQQPASPDLASILPPGVAQGTKAHDSTKKPKPEKAVDDKNATS